MIIVLRRDVTDEQIEHISDKIKEAGLTVHVSKGEDRTIVGAIGDEALVATVQLSALAGVDKVMPIMKPYKLVGREFQSKNSIIDVKGVKVGGEKIQVIAGPCSVETQEILTTTAEMVKEAGATMLRGGAFKPRTSPYDFQGLGKLGLEYLKEASEVTGLPVVSELMDPRDVDLFDEFVDLIQIGARNMQNFRLLTEVGKLGKPVILKRGMSATIKEFLMCAEYIAAQGNSNIILCERGLRTFETATRNTLDLSAVPVLKEETHLPVFVDPSHAVGRWDFVEPMARAAVAVGADGLLIEVHADPENALCDGAQSLKPKTFDSAMKGFAKVAEAVGRTM